MLIATLAGCRRASLGDAATHTAAGGRGVGTGVPQSGRDDRGLAAGRHHPEGWVPAARQVDAMVPVRLSEAVRSNRHVFGRGSHLGKVPVGTAVCVGCRKRTGHGTLVGASSRFARCHRTPNLERTTYTSSARLPEGHRRVLGDCYSTGTCTKTRSSTATSSRESRFGFQPSFRPHQVQHHCSLA